MRLRWLKVLLFPDLARYQSTKQQRHAWEVAEQAVMRRPACWGPVVIIFLIYYLLVFSLPDWGIPMSMSGKIRGALLILVLLVLIALVWASRKMIRHALRKQMVEDGIPICIKCGYDLRASKDRCPECGEEFVSSPDAR